MAPQGHGLDRRSASTRPVTLLRRRQLGNPSPPPHPLDSPEMRLLMAFLEESAVPTGKYDTVLAEEQAKMAGRVGLAQFLPASVSAEQRSRFSTGGILPGIIGVWGGPDGDFTPGLADLTEQECRAFELALAGFNSRQIAQFLDRKRTRAFGPDRLPVETVDRYLDRSRVKLRSLFGLGILGPGAVQFQTKVSEI